jgi:hypothetical protein
VAAAPPAAAPAAAAATLSSTQHRIKNRVQHITRERERVESERTGNFLFGSSVTGGGEQNLTVFVDDVTSLVAFQPRYFQKLILRATLETIRKTWIHRVPMVVWNNRMFSNLTPNPFSFPIRFICKIDITQGIKNQAGVSMNDT